MQIDIKFDNNGNIIPFLGDKKITMEESPFLIFLASIGMCSAVFVRSFLKQRDMSLKGVSIVQTVSYNETTKMAKLITILAVLPESFPAKYKNAIKKAIAQCTVKKHLASPPTFEIQTSLDLELNV